MGIYKHNDPRQGWSLPMVIMTWAWIIFVIAVLYSIAVS
jgi:hypothetical protein